MTDARRHPVSGLTREDFQVFEDGVLQPLRSFDLHAPGKSPIQPPLDLKLPPNTYANLVRGPQNGPVTVLLYDVLNTPPATLPYAHDAMVAFLKKQPPGSRTAIFILNDRLHMLQGFTDDQGRLLAAAKDKRAGTQQSGLLQTTNNPNITASEQQAQADYTTGEIASGANVLQNLKSLENTENTLMLRERLEETVDGFSQIARFLSGLPGRKNLIWLSGSFPSSVLPETDPTVGGTANEFGDSFQLGDRVREATRLLSEGHVSVYPVDVKGLEVNPTFNAANNVRFSGGHPPPSNFAAQDAAEHGTMELIATDTGGHAFYNTNGLEEAMSSAIEEGSTYYTLTYSPSNGKFDGSQRKIRVALRQPGYQLAYRTSYLAEDGAHSAPPTAQQDAAIARNVFLDSGMQRGSPISSELLVEASVVPFGPVLDATPKELESLTQFMAVATKSRKKTGAEVAAIPKVQHYEISYAVLGKQLALPPAPEGKFYTDMLFALAAYTGDNLIVNGLEVQVKNQIPAAQVTKIRSSGYHASMAFVVPVEARTLRLAARDVLGQHMGSIEIPLPVPPLKPLPADAAR